MRYYLYAVLLLATLLSPKIAVSQPIDSGLIRQLANEKKWHQLLFLNEQGEPTVFNDGFYLSQYQDFSPEKELRNTLLAFNEPVGDNPNNHALCKYKARKIWLDSQIPSFNKKNKNIKCPHFEEFKNYTQIDSISLVFATGYLGNPASYYGHLLLKLNTSSLGRLYDPAINFGADVPPNENMLIYIVKGLIGGYNSSFTTQGFFYHLQNYGENEFRDLWEYQLDLTDEERIFLLAHLWELQNRKFTYYFLNKNCAFFMANALNLVLNIPASQSWKPWVAPQTVVQQLVQFQPEKIKKRKYHPSRQSRLYQRYAKLSESEIALVTYFAENPGQLSIQALENESITSQHNVLDTLIDYYQFLRQPELKEQDPNNLQYSKVLSLRYQLPSGSGHVLFNSSNVPDLGRPLSRTSIGLFHTESGSWGILSLRPAYYDPLDSSYGHVRHSGLSMGDIKIRISQNEATTIESLNLVNILNVRQNYTMLPGDQSHSWFLHVGLQRKLHSNNFPLAGLAHAGYGYAGSFIKDSVSLAGFFGAGFHDTKLDSSGLFLSTNLMLNGYLNDLQAWNIQLERKFGFDQQATTLKATFRHKINDAMDLRFNYRYQKEINENVAGVEVGWYW